MWLNRQGETMQSSKHRVRWAVVSAYMTGMAYYSLVPRVAGPVGSAFAALGDRVLHLGGYFVLTILAAWALRGSAARRTLWAAALAFTYGIVLELGQSAVPQRTVSAMDLLFNAVGCGLGAAAYAGMAQWRRRRALRAGVHENTDR